MNSLSFYSSNNKTTILSCFFLFFVFEACIGGSGGLIQLGGGLTIRKLNFIIALFVSFCLLFYFKKIQKDVAFILIAFSITLITATVIGVINYGVSGKVLENFLMQSFFLLLPFYSLFIKNENDINIVIKILKFSALAIALVYLVVIVLMATGLTDFLSVYAIISTSAEFMGRGGNAFWFKGFLYLCLGLFFIDTEKNVFMRSIKQLLVTIAVYFTFTRGFVLAFFASITIYHLFFKSFLRGFFILVFAIVLIAAFGQYYVADSFNRADSDVVREIQFKEVMSAVTPTSLIIGHGFGEGVAIRDNHMEINYLEIFHKQGLIGIVFWLSILGYIVILYVNCKKFGAEKKAQPFFLAALFVYIQSATNPYLTNSIGLNMIMISIVSLNIYLENARENFDSSSNV